MLVINSWWIIKSGQVLGQSWFWLCSLLLKSQTRDGDQRLCKLTLLLFESTKKESHICDFPRSPLINKVSICVFFAKGRHIYFWRNQSIGIPLIFFLVKYLRLSSPSRAKTSGSIVSAIWRIVFAITYNVFERGG